MEKVKEIPDCLVLDVGANIGQYSLFAAKYGCDVVAIEPFQDNILRIHKAANLEKIQNKITLVKNALSNKRNEVKKLNEDKNNIGGQGLVPNMEAKFEMDRSNKYLVETILFDDIVPIIPRIENGKRRQAVLKIDIEGFEPFAFQHASVLFDELDIRVIFMEILMFHKIYKNQSPLVMHMMNFLQERNYMPMDFKGNKLSLIKWLEWPPDMWWKKRLADKN